MANEINEALINQLINHLESTNKSVAYTLSAQDLAVKKLALANEDLREKLTNDLFQIVSMLNKNGLGKFGTRIEQSIVENLLQAPYDAQAAFRVHKAFFTERHEMALFILENLEIFKKIVNYKIENTSSHEIIGKPKVFTYWHNQDNLPPIVQLCRSNLEKHVSSEFDLIILDEKNYKEWLDFDLEAFRTSFSKAHFTDLLRLRLLEKWGGFWLDATCLLSEDFYSATQIIRQQDQFFFSYINSRVGTWFVWSKPANYVITMVAEVLTFWWAKRNRLTNYFMLHDIIEMLYWTDDEYRKQWDAMYKIHPKNALEVLRAYTKPCSEAEFENMMNDSFVHKLNYKYDSNNILDTGSLYKLLAVVLD